VAVAVVMLGAVGIGCGGGGDETSASLTKAEYVKQADAICAERKMEWKEALASYQKKVNEQKAENDQVVQKKLVEEAVTDSMLPALEQQLESLEELGSPEGKEKQVEKMLASFSKELESVKTPTDLLETGFTDFEEEAKDLGVSCPLL
jgi:transketolase